MSRIFVDTNILIYSIDEDSKYHLDSQKILYNSDAELFTSSKNLSELLSVVTRGPVYFLTARKALIVLEDFMHILTILYPSEKSYTIFKEMLRKYQPTGLKIHDFEIASIGLANGINTIATFNKKDFKEIAEVSLIPF